MKKILTGLVLLMMLFVLVSCGKKGNEQESEHEHTHEHNDAEVTLRLALSAHEGEPYYEAVEQFASKVREKSNGTIEVTIFDSGKLGRDDTILSSMAQNEDKADIVISDVSNFTTYDARMDISKLPFAFADYDEAREFMEGEIQAEVERNLEQQNMKVLAHYTDGFHYLTLKGRTLNTPKDLQGELIATSNQGTSDIAMKILGAMTEQHEASQLQQVLQQGHCKGYEGTLNMIYNNRIYQMQNYIVVTNHYYSASCFVISNSVWNDLEKEHQEIIKNAAVTSSRAQYELVRAQDEEFLKKIESSGVRVQYPNLKMFWEKAELSVKNNPSAYGGMVDRFIMWKNSHSK